VNASLTPELTPNPYERPEWRSAAGGLLRPGGLALTDRAIAACDLSEGSHVWDIGCGLGATVAHLIRRHGFDAVGVDPSEELLDAAHARMPWLPLVHGRGDALPCATSSLDAVLAECSWSAMAADGAGADVAGNSPVLAEFRRVLRAGGWLIIGDVYARSAAGVVPAPLGDGCWQVLPTEPEIRAVVAGEGFAIERWEDHSWALREFAARMILEHGSLDPLWGAGCAVPDRRAALQAARPGYFLLVARKD
jgi:arsenite methyltransferase